MINDKQSMIWGGEATPCALGQLNSIGAINEENNAKISASVAEIMEPYGVPSDRIYINFFDIARENCGWSGRTFAR